MQSAAAAGSEAQYRGLLSAELRLVQAEADGLAQACWAVCADDYPLRIHFVRRARLLRARVELLASALGTARAPTTPHTNALVAMHHHASRDVSLLLAWEWARSGPGARVLEDTAAILRTRWSLATPMTSLFDVAEAEEAAALLGRPSEESSRFIGDVLILYRSLLDELYSSS